MKHIYRAIFYYQDGNEAEIFCFSNFNDLKKCINLLDNNLSLKSIEIIRAVKKQ